MSLKAGTLPHPRPLPKVQINTSSHILVPLALALALFAHSAPMPADAEEIPRILLGEPWQAERPPVVMRGLTIDTGAYQYGNPSPAEQAHLERINRARLDPLAEAKRLLGGDLNEGISDPALQISLTPKQPLTSNALLHAAARAHSRDMIDQDYFDHLSLDGRTPWERMAAAGSAVPVPQFRGHLTYLLGIPVAGQQGGHVARTLAALALAILTLPTPTPAGAEEMPTILLGRPWQAERLPVVLRGPTIDTEFRGQFTYLHGIPADNNRACRSPALRAMRTAL